MSYRYTYIIVIELYMGNKYFNNKSLYLMCRYAMVLKRCLHSIFRFFFRKFFKYKSIHNLYIWFQIIPTWFGFGIDNKKKNVYILKKTWKHENFFWMWIAFTLVVGKPLPICTSSTRFAFLYLFSGVLFSLNWNERIYNL